MFNGVLIVVKDIEKSKSFYCDIFGMKVTEDYGVNVSLDNSLFLQTIDTWKTFILNKNVKFKHHAGELYFTVDNLGEVVDKLSKYDIVYIHNLIEHAWGQRVIRFYDPDYNIIEVAETLENVVKRLHTNGMNNNQIHDKVGVDLDFIIKALKN